jgi:hypothetical protein
MLFGSAKEANNARILEDQEKELPSLCSNFLIWSSQNPLGANDRALPGM